MAGTRSVDAALLRFGIIDAPRVHCRAPVLEIGILNGNGDRRAEGLTPADAADDLRLVVLDLHPPAPPVPMLSPRQIRVDAGAIEPHTGRHAGDNDGELRPMRLAGRGEGEFHRAFILSEAKDLRCDSDQRARTRSMKSGLRSSQCGFFS